MIDYTRSYGFANKEFDAGLRQYMLNIYNFMTIALAITGVTAFATLSFPPLTNLIFNVGANGEFYGTTGFGLLMMIAPFAIAVYFSFTAAKIDIEKSKLLLWLYAGFNGISLSSLAFIYTGESIIRTFFITSAVFAAMSIYGYTTKKDLTSVGSFLVMGLFGMLIASLANMFFQSAAVSFVTSVVGVGIFIGLIAWDTQKLKAIYFSAGNDEIGQRLAIVGAFTLYLDFINLFIHLLRFMGNKRNND